MVRVICTTEKKTILAVVGTAVVVACTVAIVVPLLLLTGKHLSPEARSQIVEQILKDAPLIDGHNDFPWNVRLLENLTLHGFNFSDDLTKVSPWNESRSSFTDIPRLRKGLVGGQFWVAYVDCSSQYKDAVQQTFEQIDIIKRLVDLYPDDLQFATSVQEIREAKYNQKIASLIGVEGGHSIASSLGILRSMYSLGVRYMTLTHNCNTPWADSSEVDQPGRIPEHNGVTDYGKIVIQEMNRLGMIVDLSHVSHDVMVQAINVSRAPVIFSHSSAFSVCSHSRNVQDDVLRKLKEKDGIVMINFYSGFIACSGNGENATIAKVVEHINHVRDVAGVDYVGIGGDFDGVDSTAQGLDDVSHYPNLFVALLETGNWSERDLRKLAGENILRVFEKVEQVRDEMKAEGIRPFEDLLPESYLDGRTNCTTTLE